MLRNLLAFSSLLLVAAAPSDLGFRLPVENLDRAAPVEKSFYDFAVGGWRASHPIPQTRARWGAFDVLAQETREKVHALLEGTRREPGEPGTVRRKVADFWASGMDETAVESAGILPIAEELARIGCIASGAGIEADLARLQAMGVDAFFGIDSMPDPKRSSRMIGVVDQGGLGLPDPSYYLDEGAAADELRRAYVDHAAALLRLAGEPEAEASAEAAMRIETALAKASLSRVERRDPYATYHVLDRAELSKLTPGFSWDRYLDAVGRGDVASLDVTAPGFFAEVSRLLQETPAAELRAYLRLRLVDAASPYLSRAFVAERFRFSSRLTGVTEDLPRWERVLRAEDDALGFAVGRLYVEAHFSEHAREAAEEILADVRAALAADLATLPWMGDETRHRAQEKLAAMTDQIGYPTRWRDYGTLEISSEGYAANVFRAHRFEHARRLAKIGEPTDRTEWEMTPQTVNAYYEPSRNQIVFPAGILQPPFFDEHAPAAWNYGAIGAVIGHEITHGFDDEGSRFDAAGNLADWWTPEDAARFHDRTQCVSSEFSGFTVAGGVHVNGRLVTGEATADLGGVVLALRALEASGAASGPPIEGFTPPQLFFLSFAQVWASNARPEEEQLLARVDPHPPPRFRVDGTLSNLPELRAAFGVPLGSPMARETPCRIW